MYLCSSLPDLVSGLTRHPSTTTQTVGVRTQIRTRYLNVDLPLSLPTEGSFPAVSSEVGRGGSEIVHLRVTDVFSLKLNALSVFFQSVVCVFSGGATGCTPTD